MFDILYKDDGVIVIDKPVGVLSEENGSKASAPRLIKNELGIDEVYTVHRLDKNVGGAMVLALDEKSASALAADVKNRRVTKKYIAEIIGTMPEKNGVMEDLLFRDSSRKKTYIVKRERKGVRSARLWYEVIAEYDGRSLVLITLDTGRTHQIRVQFASRGFPLSGDGRYGSRDGGDKPLLHSTLLEFTSPSSGKIVSVVSIPRFAERYADIIEKKLKSPEKE